MQAPVKEYTLNKKHIPHIYKDVLPNWVWEDVLPKIGRTIADQESSEVGNTQVKKRNEKGRRL